MARLISGKGTGWKPQLPDHRDFKFAAPAEIALPDVVDLRSKMPPIWDQDQLGSCTAFATCAALMYDAIKQGEKPFTPSWLFEYYNTRALEGTIKDDVGASIRDAIKAINIDGVCHDSLWPYNENAFAVRPPCLCYVDGKKHEAVKYQAVNQTERDMLACLASGFPIVLGFSVYESFESDQVAKTGIVPMPGPNERVLGGHAVLVVGYSKDLKQFIVRNSWGESWGQKGYFQIPFDYFLNPNLASDFWQIQKVK